jgi:hypothetical protein
MLFSPSTKHFYDSDAIGDCVEVSDAVHNQVMEIVRTGGTIDINGEGGPIGVPAQTVPSLTPVQQMTVRLNNCNVEYEHRVATLRGTYPFAETTTWPVQIKESQEYTAWRAAGRIGNAPDTPFLSDLTVQRDLQGVGSGLEDLVDRVFANNEIYSPEISRLTAIRHAAEQALYVAAHVTGTFEAVDAVGWSFNVNEEPVI